VPEINLLKQNTVSDSYVYLLPKIISRFLLFVLLGCVVYYGWLLFQINSTTASIEKTQQELQEVRTQANNQTNRDELLTRQLQLGQVETLINSHIFWSGFFPELAKVTLKTATYTSLKASTAGEVSLVVTVPNLSELDKFLQVFNNPKYNTNFYNVRIGEFHKVQHDNGTAINFDIRMNFNPAILHQNGN
jgi:hypothetical protein